MIYFIALVLFLMLKSRKAKNENVIPPPTAPSHSSSKLLLESLDPNTAQDVSYLSFYTSKASKLIVEAFPYWEKEGIYSFTYKSKGGKESIPLSLYDWEAGDYQLAIYLDGGTDTLYRSLRIVK